MEYIGYTIIALAALIVLRYGARKSGGIGGGVESVSDNKTLEVYAHDKSSFKIVPEKIFYPKNVAEISEIVRMCQEEKNKGNDVSITMRAGGTCMSGGPLNTGWIVDMTKYMHSVSVDPKNKTATVEAGAYFRDIEDEAQKHGLIFAPYPSSHRICGIGGMLGNNASGEKSLRNGATGDNVLELEVVLADGSVRRIVPKDVQSVSDTTEKEIMELFHMYGEKLRTATGNVKKSASGYRLEKVMKDGTFSEAPLFVGAQGTLGIITKAVLKLVPAPEHTELVVVSGNSLADIPPIIETIRAHNPEGLETFDGNTFAKAREHITEHAEKLLPYIDEHAHLFILAQFSESTEDATKAQASACKDALIAKGFRAEYVTNPADVEGAWQVRRNSFTLMRDFNEPHHKAVPCIEDVIIPQATLGEFVSELITILEKRCVHFGYHGHIGDGSLRVIPVFDFASPTVSEEILGLMDEVFVLVRRLGGNISADHSDGIIRTPFLKSFYGDELYGVFERIKKLYDPQGIMNPNKKVGGTRAHVDTHLDRTIG